MENYKSVADFRKALEARLKQISLDRGIPLDRLRRRVAFDRLLARLFDPHAPQWLLKGGYAIELRLKDKARMTKDIDFSMPAMADVSRERVSELLHNEAVKDLQDGFEFLIGTPMTELDQAVYGGWRFPVEARLDKRTFVRFHVDVGVGDAVISEPEWQKGDELLSFAGIPAVRVALLPRDQQFAEKMHAYTFPKDIRVSSRTKDLVDLVLLIQEGLPGKEIMKRAIIATFERRKTHEMPIKLEPPPDMWKGTYEELARECSVRQKTINEAYDLISQFWNDLGFKF